MGSMDSWSSLPHQAMVRLTALPEPVLDAVAAQVRERSMVSRAVGHTRVERSKPGVDAQLVGAAELAFAPVLVAAATA
jgi:hypothetical protein